MEKSRKKMALFSQRSPTFIGAPSFFEGYGSPPEFLYEKKEKRKKKKVKKGKIKYKITKYQIKYSTNN